MIRSGKAKKKASTADAARGNFINIAPTSQRITSLPSPLGTMPPAGHSNILHRLA